MDNKPSRYYDADVAREFSELFRGYLPDKFIVEDDKISIGCTKTPEIPAVLLFKLNEESQTWWRQLTPAYEVNLFLKNAYREFEKEGKAFSAQGLADFLQEQMNSFGYDKKFGDY